MGDTAVNPQTPKATPADLVFQALNAADNFNIPNSGKMCLYLEETTSAGGTTVTIVTAATPGGLALADPTVAMGADEQKWAGPFPPSIYGDTLTITCDNTNVKIAAIDLQ